jgi:hypothetical protein
LNGERPDETSGSTEDDALVPIGTNRHTFFSLLYTNHYWI